MTEETTDAAALARRCADVMYAADEASRRLGITVHDVEPGRATARMRVDERMVNGHGVAHGGYLFLLADTAFAFACNTYGEVTLASKGDVVFVAPARLGDVLEAHACERLRFGRNGVYDVTVRRTGAGAGSGTGGDGGDAGDVVAEFRGQSRSVGQPLVTD